MARAAQASAQRLNPRAADDDRAARAKRRAGAREALSASCCEDPPAGAHRLRDSFVERPAAGGWSSTWRRLRLRLGVRLGVVRRERAERDRTATHRPPTGARVRGEVVARRALGCDGARSGAVVERPSPGFAPDIGRQPDGASACGSALVPRTTEPRRAGGVPRTGCPRSGIPRSEIPRSASYGFFRPMAGSYIRSTYSLTIRRVQKRGATVRIASLTRPTQRRGTSCSSRS